MGVLSLSDASIVTGAKRNTFWDQLSGPSGLMHLHTETFSGVSNITIDNVFSDDYVQYKIITTAVGSTLLGLNLQFRDNGTTYTSALQGWNKIQVGGTSISAGRTISETYWQNALGAFDNNQSYSMILEIINPYQSNYVSGIGLQHYSSTSTLETRSFGHGATNSFDGIYAYTSAGTVTGEIRIYGYSKGV